MDIAVTDPFACFADLPARAADDHEWRAAARYWTATVTVVVGDRAVAVHVDNGTITEVGTVEADAIDTTIGTATGAGGSDVVFHVPADAWPSMLASVPRPFFQDWMAARRHGLRVGGSVEAFYQYYPALRRLLELLRDAENGAAR